MSQQRIAIEYQQGKDVDPAQLAAAADAVRRGLALVTPKGAEKTMPEFDGKALAGLQLDIMEFQRLLGQHVIKMVAVDNGLGVSRFKVGDTIQTLDKGARDSAGRIVDFSPDGGVANYLKSNGTMGNVATTYMRHF